MTDLNAISHHLYNPYPPDLLRWEVSAQSDGGRRILVQPCIPVSHLEERLNQFAPGWTKNFQTIEPETVVRCDLTVCGITRIGLGSGSHPQEVKTRQAFVQACQAFGVGRYLRYFRAVWVSSDKAQALPDGTLVVDVSIPDWAKPGGTGCPPAASEKTEPQEADSQEAAPMQKPAKRASLLDFANQPPKTRPLDTDIASAYELKVYGDLYLKAKLAGADLSFLNVIIPPITVGELRRRYAALNRIYKDHMEKKGG